MRVLEEVEPVDEPRRRRRRASREDDREQIEPARSSGKGAVWVVLLVICVLGVAFGLFFARGFWTSSKPLGVGISGFGAQAKAQPIKPEEFKEVLATLQNKPSIETLRELAGRLAETTPTEEQQKKFKQVKQMGELGATAPALEEAQKNDDIFQVSRALNPLLAKDAQPMDKMLAAQAMQHWGTADNVLLLIPYIVEANEEGVFDRRINVARGPGRDRRHARHPGRGGADE